MRWTRPILAGALLAGLAAGPISAADRSPTTRPVRGSGHSAIAPSPATRPAEPGRAIRRLFDRLHSDSPPDRTELSRLLDSPSPKVRQLAVIGLGRSTANIPAIAGRLDDPDARVRAAAVLILAKLRTRTHQPEIIQRLDDPADLVRAAACRAVMFLRIATLLPALRDRLKNDPSEFVRLQAMGALVKLHGRQAAALLMQALRKDESPVLRCEAILLLRRLRARRALPILKTLAMHDPDTDVRALALRSVGDWAEARTVRRLVRDLVREALVDAPPGTASPDEPTPQERHRRSVRLLGALGRPAVPLLIQALQERDVRIRLLAVESLAAISDPRARKPLAGLEQRDPEPRIRAAAERALQTLAKTKQPRK
jgi:HEAT repeat protein